MQIDNWPADLYADDVDEDSDREDRLGSARRIINGVVFFGAMLALTGFWFLEAL